MFGAFDISTSALSAQRTRLETIASNIANIDSVAGKDGKASPYHRIFTVFQAGRSDGGPGVHVSEISQDDETACPVKHEPGNPFADSQGNVQYPNVDLSSEMVNAIETTRAYEANITAIETTKTMMTSTMRLLA